MFCVACQKDLAFCSCSDMDKKLKELKDHPNIELGWCDTCDKHLSRCTCGVKQ